ncbi:MAG: flavodoxin domain-containing protein [Muribaculaceae bacterium]|nr:flavodoxin domain-containing protein [Muribaculaceae bacterium]MDE6541588.1 flavodoxin domain-containing protein [Muribaculaceae bacterium]
MKKYGIFYATSTGRTARVASAIAKALGVADDDVHNVADTAPSVLGDYEVAILGSPTYAAGDMQANMDDFIDGAQALDLKGHKLAFFGTGDDTMAHTFCSAVGDMAKALSATGAVQIGEFDAKGYVFDDSEAEIAPGVYAGLLLDSVNHPELDAPRIAAWTAALRDE